MGGIDLWKTLSAVATELGVSKNVIKYQKKFLEDKEIRWEDGKITISPDGVRLINQRIKKKSSEKQLNEVDLKKDLLTIMEELEEIKKLNYGGNDVISVNAATELRSDLEEKFIYLNNRIKGITDTLEKKEETNLSLSKSMIMFLEERFLHFENRLQLMMKKDSNEKSRFDLIDKDYFQTKFTKLEEKMNEVKKSTEENKSLTNTNLSSEVAAILDDEFIAWYCKEQEISGWSDWRWQFVKLSELIDYLKVIEEKKEENGGK